MSIKFIRWFKHKDLEGIAAEIHRRLKCEVPVDIDYIVEFAGLDIFDIERLKEDFGLYGSLAKVNKKFTIYVQRGDLKLTNYHTNFTIAEELSHYILHRDHFKNVNNFEEAYEFYNKISSTSEIKLELDAKYLAAAILLPRDHLRKKATEIYREYESIFKDVLNKDYEEIIDRIASRLSDIYRVPEGVISHRLKRPALKFKDFLKRELNNNNT